MGSFGEDVAAATKRPVGDKFTEVCESMKERGELEDFLQHLDDPKVPGTALESALAARDITVSDSTLLLWRRKRLS